MRDSANSERNTDSQGQAETRPVPVARGSVAEGVADHIRELVFRGTLRDGERVPQREIAAVLGVSSVPVREALAALQREGVVTIEPNRGAFVNGLDADVVIEQFHIFGCIYGLAARTAAGRSDPSLVETLADLAERIAVERDLDTLLDLGIQFQLLIVDHGGSKRLRALFTPLSRIVPGNFFVTVPGSVEISRRAVPEILEAIRLRRPEAAEQTCCKLMGEIGQLVAAGFRRRAQTVSP